MANTSKWLEQGGVACGCQLTRDMEKHLRNSSFQIDEMINVPPFAGMNSIYTHIRGIATKPGKTK